MNKSVSQSGTLFCVFDRMDETKRSCGYEIHRIFGADNQSRTGDLMLTKHVLYQLSYISVKSVLLSTDTIIADSLGFVKGFFQFFRGIFAFLCEMPGTACG